MRNYEEIMGLVEEVRGLLDGDVVDEAATHAHLAKKHGVETHFIKKHKGRTPHNPFKNLKKNKRLGPAVRGSDRTPGKKRGYWRCRCQSYKCVCFAKTAEGKTVKKIVRINKTWKGTYNEKYRTWREKHKARYKAGGKGGFKKPAKPGDPHHTAAGHSF